MTRARGREPSRLREQNAGSLSPQSQCSLHLREQPWTTGLPQTFSLPTRRTTVSLSAPSLSR